MDYGHLFLTVILLVTILALVVFVYRYASFKARLPWLVQEEMEAWKRQAEFSMQDKIRQRVQEWRDRESQGILAQAQRDALVQAQQLFRAWCEEELQHLRREQRALAVREAQTLLQEWKLEQERQIRQEAIQRSQAVTTGKITEQLVPYLPNFSYNPKDARFIGSPIDLIVFDGLNDDEEWYIRDVVFIEIKTGNAGLTRREKLVRDAIRAGRVKWVEWNASRDLPTGEARLFE